MSCPFCFGTLCKDELDFNTWCKLLDLFWDCHVKYLVITGGEPTIYKNLLDVLKYAKHKGFFLILSSNGLKIDLMEYCKYIDVLSLPLDGQDYEQCKTMRGMTKDQYLCVLNNMKLFKTIYPNKKLKIGTVITKRNMSNIENIYKVISKYADVWKLYQVSKHERNTTIYESALEITDQQFSSVGQYIYKKYGEQIQICSYRNYDRSGKYLFCESNADAMVISAGNERIIGNFLHDYDHILETWPQYVKTDLLMDNVISTYMIE